MTRWVILLGLLGACVPADAYDRNMLGRWDVTVLGDDGYPLWFELVEENGSLSGRLQPRGGHARPLERIETSGSSLTMELLGTVYEGTLENGTWSGTGSKEEGPRFEWKAVRAPELPAPENVVWSDEVIQLFNGEDLAGWIPRHRQAPSHWSAVDGVLVNRESGSDLMTEATFRNFQLHVEVNVPAGGNSGIYLRGRHEVQVQDDYGKPADSLHMGGVYGQITPTENAAKPAGEWQSFDITLLGRWVTVVLNGSTIIDNREIPGITGGALDSNEGEPGPILLQGDHGPVRYRNLRLTEAR